MFNVFDTVGRYMGGLEFFDIQIRKINICSYLRTIFILTFLLTDFMAAPLWLWDSDTFKILNIVAFAFTNGYISTLCAVKAPQTVEIQRRNQVGAYIGTCIQLGVLLGCIFQLGMGPVHALTPKKKGA